MTGEVKIPVKGENGLIGGAVFREFPGLGGIKAKIDELVKSRNSIVFVIPAKAGIQLFQDVLDPGFRRGDAPRDFLRDHQDSYPEFLDRGGCKW
jgi:hypothetical protein